MAKPELDDGFTRIANEILGALMRINLSAYEASVLWLILRNTYGWQRKEGLLSLGFIAEGTGIRKPHVSRALRSLRNKNMIVARAVGGRVRRVYAFQKDYERWNVTWRGNRPYRGQTSEAMYEALRAHGGKCARCGWDEGITDWHHVDHYRVIALCPNCHRLATLGLLTEESLPAEAIVDVSEGRPLPEEAKIITFKGKEKLPEGVRNLTSTGTQQRKKKESKKENHHDESNHPLPKEVTERQKTIAAFVQLYVPSPPGVEMPYRDYPSSPILDDVDLLAALWGDKVVQDAIATAASAGKTRVGPNYLSAILKRWYKEGKIQPLLDEREYDHYEQSR